MQPPTLVTKDAVTEETSRTNAPGFRRVAFRAIATSAAAGAARRFGAGWSRATEPPQESQASDWREPVLRRSVGAGYSAALLKPVLSRRLDGSLAACAAHITRRLIVLHP